MTGSQKRAFTELEVSYVAIHQSLLSHKLLYNGGFLNFELPLLVRNLTHVAQIFCGLSYKV